ncbi:MAG: prepilin-type N-terminal cleavage/methylation domain-containing protein, partial [Clostridia bacterium]
MRKNTKGFTLVELLVVIVIVGILAGVLIPTFAGVIKRAHVDTVVEATSNLNTSISILKAEGLKLEDIYENGEPSMVKLKDKLKTVDSNVEGQFKTLNAAINNDCYVFFDYATLSFLIKDSDEIVALATGTKIANNVINQAFADMPKLSSKDYAFPQNQIIKGMGIANYASADQKGNRSGNKLIDSLSIYEDIMANRKKNATEYYSVNDYFSALANFKQNDASKQGSAENSLITNALSRVFVNVTAAKLESAIIPTSTLLTLLGKCPPPTVANTPVLPSAAALKQSEKTYVLPSDLFAQYPTTATVNITIPEDIAIHLDLLAMVATCPSVIINVTDTTKINTETTNSGLTATTQPYSTAKDTLPQSNNIVTVTPGQNTRVTNISYAEGCLFWDRSEKATNYTVIVNGLSRTTSVNFLQVDTNAYQVGDIISVEIIAKGGNQTDSLPSCASFTAGAKVVYEAIKNASGDVIGQKSTASKTYILFKGMTYDFADAVISINMQTDNAFTLSEQNKKLTASSVGYGVITLTKGADTATWKVRIVEHTATLTLGTDYNIYCDNIKNLQSEGYIDATVVPYTVGASNVFIPDILINMPFDSGYFNYELKEGTNGTNVFDTYATIVSGGIQFNLTDPDTTGTKASAVGKTFFLKITSKYQTNLSVEMKVTVNDGHNVYTQEDMRNCFADLNVHTVNLLRTLRLKTAHTSANFYDADTECNCVGNMYYDQKENFYHVVEKTVGEYKTYVYNQTKEGVVTYDEVAVNRSTDGKTISFTRTKKGVAEVITAWLLVDESGKPLGHARANDGNSMAGEKAQNCNPFVRFEDTVANTITVNGNYFAVDGSRLARLGYCENKHGVYNAVGNSNAKLANSYQAIFQSARCDKVGNAVVGANGVRFGELNKMVFNNLRIIGNNKRPDGTDVNGDPVNEKYYETSGFICIKGFGDIDVTNCILTSGSSGITYHADKINTGFSKSYVKNTRIYNTTTFNLDTFACYETTVEDCHLSNSGGPLVYLIDKFEDTTNNSPTNNPKYIFKGNNTFDNWVSGTELWFVASGFSGLATNVKGTVEANIILYTGNAMQAIKKENATAVEKMNFIMCGTGDGSNLNPCWDIKFVNKEGAATTYAYDLSRPFFFNPDSDAQTPDINNNDPRKQGGAFMAPVNEYSQVTAFAGAVTAAQTEVTTALGKNNSGLTEKEQFIV